MRKTWPRRFIIQRGTAAVKSYNRIRRLPLRSCGMTATKCRRTDSVNITKVGHIPVRNRINPRSWISRRCLFHADIYIMQVIIPCRFMQLNFTQVFIPWRCLTHAGGVAPYSITGCGKQGGTAKYIPRPYVGWRYFYFPCVWYYSFGRNNDD